MLLALLEPAAAAPCSSTRKFLTLTPQRKTLPGFLGCRWASSQTVSAPWSALGTAGARSAMQPAPCPHSKSLPAYAGLCVPLPLDIKGQPWGEVTLRL